LTEAYIIVNEEAFSDATSPLSYKIVGTGFKEGQANTEFTVERDELYLTGVKFILSGFSFTREDAYGENGKEILAYVAATDDATPAQTTNSVFYIKPLCKFSINLLIISIECYTDCYTCTGLESDECASCDGVDGKYLTGTNTCGACESNEYDDDDFVCQTCDPLCTTCSSDGTDTETNDCVCASVTYDTTCLAECPADTTHNRDDVCIGKIIFTSY